MDLQWKSEKGVAVVTGASSGIGEAYAHGLAKRGYDLLLIARRGDRLRDLSASLRRGNDIVVDSKVADLTSESDLKDVAAQVAGEDAITLLVNNAGTAVVKPLAESQPDELEPMIKLNIVALTRLTMAVLPRFKAKNAGTIINIGSVLGFEKYKLTGVYGGTKSYVLNFTRALQEELSDTRVIVQLVAPATTSSEIWQVAGISASDFDPKTVMSPEACAEASLRGLDKGEPISMPSLEDAGLLENYEQAANALYMGALTGSPASRYSL